TRPVAHLDLMPTVLDLVGAPHPVGLEGESFAPVLRGEAQPSTRDRPLFSASWVLPEGLLPPALTVRLGMRKLIRLTTPGGTRSEYYDLGADPGEHSGLWPARASEAADLRSMLDRHQEAVDTLRQAMGGGDAEDRQVPLDPQREEKLRSLGYIR